MTPLYVVDDKIRAISGHQGSLTYQMPRIALVSITLRVSLLVTTLLLVSQHEACVLNMSGDCACKPLLSREARLCLSGGLSNTECLTTDLTLLLSSELIHTVPCPAEHHVMLQAVLEPLLPPSRCCCTQSWPMQQTR